MTQANVTDELKRTIVLIYGIIGDGSPFWVFAAVKPASYQQFQDTYKEGKLDIHKFDAFGKIIICGAGKSPPDEVTLKVAEMYQTSADILMKAMKE